MFFFFEIIIYVYEFDKDFFKIRWLWQRLYKFILWGIFIVKKKKEN